MDFKYMSASRMILHWNCGMCCQALYRPSSCLLLGHLFCSPFTALRCSCDYISPPFWAPRYRNKFIWSCRKTYKFVYGHVYPAQPFYCVRIFFKTLLYAGSMKFGTQIVACVSMRLIMYMLLSVSYFCTFCTRKYAENLEILFKKHLFN
jgi:hypothetical protein